LVVPVEAGQGVDFGDVGFAEEGEGIVHGGIGEWERR
jgi:hypothetical protein